jgi:hypothetical protein
MQPGNNVVPADFACEPKRLSAIQRLQLTRRQAGPSQNSVDCVAQPSVPAGKYQPCSAT